MNTSENNKKIPIETMLISFEDDLLGEVMGCDLKITDESATLEDFMEALDAFAAQYMEDCRGCDSCCKERAPITSLDIAALSTLLADTPYPAHEVCRAFAEVTVEDGITDFAFRRPQNGACINLDPEKRICKHWMQRAFVCRSHFCLPRSPRIQDLREEIVNAGENELTRLLLAEEANGAPTLLGKPLASLIDPSDYETTPLAGYTSAKDVILKQVLSPELWQELIR